MNRSILLLIVFVGLIPFATFCQQSVILKGSIRDSVSKLPLPYASIGVLNMPYGSVADTLGAYSFTVDQYSQNDTVQVSMVGYFTQRIAILDFIKFPGKAVFLIKKPEMLQEVVVSSKGMKTEVLGRESSGTFTQVSLHKKGSAQETIGSEFGIRMSTDHPSAILKDFNWNFSSNNFKSIKLRLNVYAVKDDYPDTLLCKEQIFATLTPFKTGWSRIDLEDYNITVKGEFIVTLQWLECVTDNNKNPVTLIPVAFTPFSRNCYVRVASQDKWQRFKMKPSCYATILY